MLNHPLVFLLLLLIIGIFGKSNSLIIAVSVLIFLKLIGADVKLFTIIQTKGINWGVTVITVALLAPIASGYIGFKELGEAIKSPYAWIALISGMAVALIAKYGLHLLTEDPHITTALVIGTIIAVTVFKGVAVGPLIAAGIAYFLMKAFELFQP